MKIQAFSLTLCICIIVFLSQCNGYEDDYTYPEEYMHNISDSSRQLGIAVAQDLNRCVKNMHKSGISYANLPDSVEFRSKFYDDYFRIGAKGSSQKKLQNTISQFPHEFDKQYRNLTEIQRLFIERIIDNCRNCSSYDDFYLALSKINSDIIIQVPKIQQERLFNVTSVLYFGMKEIQQLQRQGLLPETPMSTMKLALSRSSSESDKLVSEGAFCYRKLAVAWAIAVGEPTPAGEVVAAVMTVYYGALLLYEVLLCTDSNNTSDNMSSQKENEIQTYCRERFEDCYSPIPDGCGQCLLFCLQQGYWPPYETHKCR